MTPERQEQLRRLDRQLHEQDTQKQAHLTHVLGDYAAWLTRLPAAQQQRVQQAASTTERLQVIRDIRKQQWLAGLPRVQQEEYRAAPDKHKAELLAKWHKEEQKRDQEWASARRQWQEVGERPQAIVGQEEFRYFVQNKLRPMLSPEENARLTEVWAKSNHAQYVRAVVELADKHPVLMLDKSPKYPNFESLPPEYKEAIRKLPGEVAQQVRRNPATGRSPAYALEVTETLRRYERGAEEATGTGDSSGLLGGYRAVCAKSPAGRSTTTQSGRRPLARIPEDVARIGAPTQSCVARVVAPRRSAALGTGAPKAAVSGHCHEPAGQPCTTVFTNLPMPVISMVILSPACSVKSSGGTTPVPVNSTAPCGKRFSQTQPVHKIFQRPGHFRQVRCALKCAVCPCVRSSI